MAITLIVKCTRRCNIRCTYCHDWRAKGKKSIDFSQLARLTKESLDAHGEVNFIWHGGEPLLLGVKWFEKAVALQGLFRNSGNKITNSIQTNGILLDDEWLSFLKENNFSVGISLDGPPSTHDVTRVDAKGIGTYSSVMKALASLRLNSIPYGVLVVVTDTIIELGASSIYQWLKSERIESVGFLPQRPDTVDLATVRTPSPSSKFLSRESYSAFLTNIAKLWWNDNGEGPRIRDLETFVNGLVNKKPGICIYQGSCVGKYFGIDINGDVYHCDRYIPESTYVVGNLSSNSSWVDTKKLAAIARNASEGELRSATCRWHSICHGGCPHDRHADRDGWESRNHCCGMSEVIDLLASRIVDSLPVSLRTTSCLKFY